MTNRRSLLMNIFTLAKALVRQISDLLVIQPTLIALFPNKDVSIEDLQLRLRHFGTVGRGISVHLPDMVMQMDGSGSISSSRSGICAFIYCMLVGRICVLCDGKVSLLFEKLLPAKVYIVLWTGTYRNSSWRFHEAFSLHRRKIKSRCRNPIPPCAYKRNERVIIMGTGPSSSLIYSSAASKYDLITCNTAVKSERLFQSQNIVAHCFSDATFMAGASAYSHAFLSDLRIRMSSRNFHLVHDAMHAGFLSQYLGTTKSGNLIPIFLDPCNSKVPTFSKHSFQYSYTNVLTALLLPVALSWYDEVYMVGFDGKGTTKNYFWSHQDDFQYQDLLPTVRECDPGFFSTVDYDKYSREHEQYLSSLLAEALRMGKRIHSINASSLSCINALHEESLLQEFVSGISK